MSNFESSFTDLLSTLPTSSSSGASTSASADLLRTKRLRDNGSLTLAITPLSPPRVGEGTKSSKVSLPTEAELRARGGVKLRTTNGAGLLGAGLFGGLGVGEGLGGSLGGKGKGGKGKGKGKGRGNGNGKVAAKRAQKDTKYSKQHGNRRGGTKGTKN